MDDPRHRLWDEPRMACHREYYAQFVSPAVIAHVLRHIAPDWLLASTSPHLNDIPLQKWDELVASMLLRSSLFARTGETRAPASLVCIAKEAAQQWIDNQGERHAN